MPYPSQPPLPDRRNRLKRKVVLFIAAVGGLVLALMWLLVWKAPAQPEPRIVQEIESFHLRFHEGLALLAREKNLEDMVRVNVAEGGSDEEAIGIYRRERTWTLPSEVLPAGDLFAFSEVVLEGWQAPEAYPSQGQGGGGGGFDFSFGDSKSHAQVLLTAIYRDGMTRIHSQSCAIESSPNDELQAPISETQFTMSPESLDQLRSLFTSELERLCTLYTVPSKHPRERHLYRFDRPGDGFISAKLRERAWRWTVPSEVLEADELRAFANRMSATWMPAYEASPGEDHTYSLARGDGTRSAFVSIIAIPGNSSARDAFPDTRVYYRELFFNASQQGQQVETGPIAESSPLDLEALLQVPGSTQREAAAYAKLDSDGRRLKSLRERAQKSVGTWKIRYRLVFSLPPREAEIEAFATSHGMTWEMKSTPESNHRKKWTSLRFFKIMEFSEKTIVETTSEVRQFAKDHVGKYSGWSYGSDQITELPSEDRQ